MRIKEVITNHKSTQEDIQHLYEKGVRDKEEFLFLYGYNVFALEAALSPEQFDSLVTGTYVPGTSAQQFDKWANEVIDKWNKGKKEKDKFHGIIRKGKAYPDEFKNFDSWY